MPENPIFVMGSSSFRGSGLQNLWNVEETSLGDAAFLAISYKSAYPRIYTMPPMLCR